MQGLKEELIKRIRHNSRQMVSFRDYMDLCLYHPQEGYYMQDRDKIGKKGDFYTSSTVHPVFAQTMARFVLKLTALWNRPLRICEIGGGTGQFARQFLDEVQATDPKRYEQTKYIMIEKSAYHQNKQQDLLQVHQGHVNWLNDFRSEGKRFAGVLVANELFDAFPVHVVEKETSGWVEIGVGYNAELDRFVEEKHPLENQAIMRYLEKFDLPVTEGQRIEVPLDAIHWLRETALWMEEGICLFMDYGYQIKDLRHPRYHRGTLRSFFRHQVDQALYDRPGQKDITADVCFDVLSLTAKHYGFKEVGLFSQSDFLLMAGILDLWEEHEASDPFHPTAVKNRAIRSLVSPGGISDAFSVLVLAKGVPERVLELFTPFSFAEQIKRGN